MAKTKKKKSGILGMILGFLLGGALGLALAAYMEFSIPDGLTPFQMIGRMVCMLLLLYASVFLQIVIHEAGHLIFGLASGYRFVSFRVGSLQLTRRNGKLKCSRHSLAGTAGQCLMSPPDMVDGKFPVMLYNLGGALVNLITAALCLLLFLILDRESLLSSFCLDMAVFGLMFALTNGIPMRLGAVDNDGYNALSLGKNKDAMRGLWLQLKVNEQLSEGKRLKEMPDEWFTVPKDEAMGNSMVAAVGALACNRLMDQNRYEEADSLMAHMLEIDSGMVGVHRNLLICDLMCCEMIGHNRREVIGEMDTLELRGFMKSMKKYPSVIRTRYLYALLVERDTKKAASCLESFEKVAKTYPYPNEILSEREMIAIAQGKSECKEQYNG